MKDPYKVLGLSPESSQPELRSQYEALRQKYSEDRFLEGDAGNEAARKLMELEDAWILISSDLQRRESSQQFGGDWGEIDSLIKDGKYDQAQSTMDGIKVRTAEWHYYQSIIYYKREWLSESRAQLAMAVSMDPGNTKYSEALQRLDAVMGNPKADQQSFNNQGAFGDPAYNRQNDMSSSLCRCCQIYCCLECLSQCLCSMCCH